MVTLVVTHAPPGYPAEISTAFSCAEELSSKQHCSASHILPLFSAYPQHGL